MSSSSTRGWLSARWCQGGTWKESTSLTQGEESHSVLSTCINLSILVRQLPGYYSYITWLKDHVTSPVLLSSLHSCWEEPFTGREAETHGPQQSGASLGLEPWRACSLSHFHCPGIYLRGLGLHREMNPIGTILYRPCYCAR